MSFFSALKSLFGLSTGTPKLSAGDRMLNCEDCNSPFVFDAGEQQFFKEKGFTDPKRCPRCRKKVRSRMRRRGRGGHGGGGEGNRQQGHGHNHHNQNQGHGNNHRGGNNRDRGNRFSRRHSVIDGDSPYADER